VRNGIVVAASDRVDPELPVDEAWGINGCASVLSAILAALLAMHVGFTGVVTMAAILYLVAPALLAGSRDRYDQQTSQGFTPDRNR